jgi:hypothetical protein
MSILELLGFSFAIYQSIPGQSEELAAEMSEP